MKKLLLLFILLSASAFAQTVILSQGNRGPGTFTSASATVTTPAPDHVRLTANLTASERIDTTLTFTFYLELFFPDVGIWVRDTGVTYDGSTWMAKNRDANGDPFTGETTSGMAGRQVRAVVDLPKKISIGATLTCFDSSNSVIACQ